ncbi:MAG: hypothetical protein RIC54_23900 [Thalassobaculum sp.]|uniref:hypothetical protein n=1 Tax=Thalassobaculum sp. TaxID=2022740 RepID=UPI0032F008C3
MADNCSALYGRANESHLRRDAESHRSAEEAGQQRTAVQVVALALVTIGGGQGLAGVGDRYHVDH